MQHPLGHLDWKTELGQFRELVLVHNADSGSTGESELETEGEVQMTGFAVQGQCLSLKDNFLR